MKAKDGNVYFASNKNRTTLYIGVTSNLHNRIYEHKDGLGSAFTKKYNFTDLMYFEFYDDIETATDREEQMKKWERAYKENVINKKNLIGLICLIKLKDINSEIIGCAYAKNPILDPIIHPSQACCSC